MKVLIIEDEQSVAKNLCDILLEIDPSIQVLAILESIKEAVSWIKSDTQLPDLAFFDIQIADGNSFEIFEQIKISFPIVFTTAFDEYALKAFKVNSIDYILKPIKRSALEIALNKYEAIYSKTINYNNLLKAVQDIKSAQKRRYKRNLLVYLKDKILPIPIEDIAYFYLENHTVFCITHHNEKYFIDQSLERLQSQIDPEYFFRANRQFLVAKKAIKSASIYFSRKLKLEVKPTFNNDIIVSKLNASKLKKWLTE
ncbi:MAG: LytTR family DNA-binding domain-containing protein [Saprospiraceae bacterium]|nr:LytTR family DNA-binding domain-containing protein [Saprospiraceae bacterium]